VDGNPRVSASTSLPHHFLRRILRDDRPMSVRGIMFREPRGCKIQDVFDHFPGRIVQNAALLSFGKDRKQLPANLSGLFQDKDRKFFFT
jgi:hypothetical protein